MYIKKLLLPCFICFVFLWSYDTSAQFRPTPQPPLTQSLKSVLPNPEWPEVIIDDHKSRSESKTSHGDVKDYYDDLQIVDKIYNHASKLLIITFHPAQRIRLKAMRQELSSHHEDMISTAVKTASKVLEMQRALTVAELDDVNNSYLGLGRFRWQTKKKLRANLEEIAKHEIAVKALAEEARDDAFGRVQNWAPNHGWERRGRVEFSTGSAFQQLQTISQIGWTGF